MSFHVSPIAPRFGAIRIEGFAPEKQNPSPNNTLPVQDCSRYSGFTVPL
jgi:hypothetical protein